MFVTKINSVAVFLTGFWLLNPLFQQYHTHSQNLFTLPNLTTPSADSSKEFEMPAVDRNFLLREGPQDAPANGVVKKRFIMRHYVRPPEEHN